MLPPGQAEPGPFRASRTPYTISLHRAFVDPQYRMVVGVMATQMAKTTLVANVIGERLDDDPVPVIYVGPTRDFVERKWEPQFEAMVDSVPSLAGKRAPREEQSKSLKRINGVGVYFVWAGSASSIAGQPAGLVIVDERDRMGSDVVGEGDVVTLANARHTTYADGKTGVFSTPNTGTVVAAKHEETGLIHWQPSDKLGSPTWRHWQQGTRHEWMWPCPHCSTYFAPRLKLLTYPVVDDPAELTPDNVLLACPHCGGTMREDQRVLLNERGVAVSPGQRVVDGATVGDGRRSDCYSLWVSGLCSPWRSWAEAARDYRTAELGGSTEEMQAVVNTVFGEVYAISGEAPRWEAVGHLRDAYVLGEIPDGVHTIVMTVDVQQDRLYYVVRAWSVRRNMESWLLDYGTIEGETNVPVNQGVWAALSEFKRKRYGSRTIKRCFVDQKYRSQYVFAFCHAHRQWAAPAAGRLPKTSDAASQAPLKTSAIEVDARGKIVKRGGSLKRWTINTDFFKRWIHDRVSLGDRGGFHLPIDATDDYCQQIVAETRVVRQNGRVEWIALQRDNHYLDCEQMAVACAYSLRLQHYAQPPRSKTDQVATDDAPAVRPVEPRVEPPKPPPPPPQPRRTGWMGRSGGGWMRR